MYSSTIFSGGPRVWTALVVIVAIGGASALAGCGSSDNSSDASATVPPVGQTPPAAAASGSSDAVTTPAGASASSKKSASSSGGSATKSKSRKTSSTEASSSSSSTASSRPKSSYLPQSGKGNAKLGTLVVKRKSIMTLSGTDARGVSIDDESHIIALTTLGKGESVVEPGTYKGVAVTTRKSWKLSFKTFKTP